MYLSLLIFIQFFKPDELLWPVVEELQKLGKETVIIVLILLSMIVVLVAIISFMYRKTLVSSTRFHNLQRQALTQFIKLYQYMT